MVIVLKHFGILLAEQDVHEMARAESLAAFAFEPQHGGQHLLRGHGAVPGFRRHKAGVAVAARTTRLAEVGEQLRAATAHRLAQGEHRFQVQLQLAAMCRVTFRRIDHFALLHNIIESVHHPRGRRLAVAPSTTGLLVVALHGFGQIQVRDKTHIGFIDAHAERDSGDHDEAFFAQKTRLVGGTGAVVQACVIGHGTDAVVGEERRGLLHRIA